MNSRYNFIIKLKKGSALFNGLFGTVDLCDDDTARLLKAGDESAFSDEIRKKLYERGYLTEIEETKLLDRISQFLSAHEPRDVDLYLLPTYDCNFRCPYCYEKNRLEKGKSWLEHRMSPGLVNSIFQMFDQEPLGWKLSKVTLFGGEPLLPENRPIIELILKETEKRNLPVMIISNGYTLDEYLDLLRGKQIEKIQITLDGPEKVHNQRRFLKDGAPSYQKIMDNIDLALKEGLNIVIRMNLEPETVGYKEQFRKEAESRGWTECGNFEIYYADTYHGSIVPPGESLTGVFNLMVDLLDILKNHKKIPFQNKACSALRNGWKVDPYGDVYPCTRFLGQKEYSFATISEEGIEFQWDLFLALQSRVSTTMKKCRTCPLVFICRGGCLLPVLQKQGGIQDPYCGYQKEEMELALRKILNQMVSDSSSIKDQMKKKHYLIDMTDSVITPELLKSYETEETVKD